MGARIAIHAMTWVKTKVDDTTDSIIRSYQDKHDLNKVEAVRELLRQGAQLETNE